MSLHLEYIHLPAFIQTLTTLYLSANQIGAKSERYLGAALKKNTTLVTLVFIYNQIKAQDPQYPSEGLRKNTTLTTLNVDNNQM
ncbi:unnamed protein product [Adineta steineri]|uniref:Uncharacterized protein n=1 Tax=Adineta steineri TaxID=433720 RepID=A0A814BS25_9BILA|nr:unnamed protein product [Adineta steineri]